MRDQNRQIFSKIGTILSIFGPQMSLACPEAIFGEEEGAFGPKSDSSLPPLLFAFGWPNLANSPGDTCGGIFGFVPSVGFGQFLRIWWPKNTFCRSKDFKDFCEIFWIFSHFPDHHLLFLRFFFFCRHIVHRDETGGPDGGRADPGHGAPDAARERHGQRQILGFKDQVRNF